MTDLKKQMIEKIEFQKNGLNFLEEIGLKKIDSPYSNKRQKNIKKYLKYKFPGVKISVRKDGVDAVFIEVDGSRELANQVHKAAQIFCSGKCDYLSDYHWSETNVFQDYFGGFQYVFAQAKLY